MAEQMSLMPAPGDSVAMESRAQEEPECPECGGSVPPQEVHRGTEKHYCSDRCRSRAYDRSHPRVPVQNSDKMTRAEKILVRLRQGPATGLDLLKAGGGTRYGARIYDLRELGHRIHGPVEVYARSDGATDLLAVLEAIPKTAEGWDQYELREK